MLLRRLLKLITISSIIFFLFSCKEEVIDTTGFQSNWQSEAELERIWGGEDYWLNPLQDWVQKDGKLQIVASGGDRNCVLLTRALNDSVGSFEMSVDFDWVASDIADKEANKGWLGFQVGLVGEFNDYRDDAVHGEGFCAGITQGGIPFIGYVQNENSIDTILIESGSLRLTVSPVEEDFYKVKIILSNKEGKALDSLEREVHRTWLDKGYFALTGSKDLPDTMSLVVSRPKNIHEIPDLGKASGGNTSYAFSNWKVSGDKVSRYEERAFGPILWTQYTFSDGILKMSAQFAPIGNDNRTADLYINGKKVGTATIDTDARNAIFKIENLSQEKAHNYEIRYTNNQGIVVTYNGIIKSSKNNGTLKVASISCIDDVGFPHQDLVSNILDHDVDMYAFHGDQIYERVAGYGVERTSIVDYLRKWYIFGWSFKEAIRDHPSVIIPDDHDVYHGNLWGEGGDIIDVDSLGYGYLAQDAGGYKERPQFINVVHRTQTGSLPDCPDPTPVKNGISVYYTNVNYRGVSFAVLADRQWKSAPKRLFPKSEMENGWPQNLGWNPKVDAFHADAELLGKRQENFLETWVGDWEEDIYMKAVISQTPFCNVATLPKDIYHDKYVPGLPRYKKGEYPPDDRPAADFDSNGWPQNKRNKAIKTIRKAFALHFTGDQHLGSTGRYGVDEYDDGGFWISSPAVANLWPRRWFPAEYGVDGKPESGNRYIGKYEDGFGNKITVKGIANPYDRERKPDRLFDKAPGYSIIVFNTIERSMDLAVWPRWASPKLEQNNQPFEDWPISIKQMDNYGRKAVGKLSAIELDGNTLVKVFNETTNTLEYAIKPVEGSFEPFIFDTAATYTVELSKGEAVIKKQKGIILNNF